jgi:hypothetical protein
LDPGSRWRLARLLGALDLHGLLGKPLKRAAAVSVELERRFLTVGASMMVGAPETIHELIARIRVGAPFHGGAQLIGDAFPGLLSILRKRLDPLGRDWLMQHLQAYTVGTLASSAPVLWRQRAVKSTSTATSIGRQLRVRPERVVSIADRFEVTPVNRVTASGRRMMNFAPSDVERLRAGLDDDLSLTAASNRFGLSVPRLKILLDADTLCRTEVGVSASSVAELVGQITRHASRVDEHNCGAFLSLPQAMRLHVPATRTVDFINALGKTIPVFATSAVTTPSTASWTFRELCVRREGLTGSYGNARPLVR